MTYDELAAVRGIKRIGAVRLVQRYKWRRQAGNDGKARILVPHDALAPVRGTDAGSDASDGAVTVDDKPNADGAGTDAGHLLAGALATFEAALGALRDSHGAEVAALRDSHTAELTGLQTQLTDAQEAAQAAQDAAEALRQRERAWWGQGRWQRLRAAWRGQ
jgi:hypothetical protein